MARLLLPPETSLREEHITFLNLQGLGAHFTCYHQSEKTRQPQLRKETALQYAEVQSGGNRQSDSSRFVTLMQTAVDAHFRICGY